nr:MAG TPA: hypothetical protein [Caudoviricetes sp.]
MKQKKPAQNFLEIIICSFNIKGLRLLFLLIFQV